MEPGFFPLDEELALPPGHLTPFVHERLVDLGTWMPFEQARKQTGRIFKIEVGEATVRRYVEKAGRAYEALQTAKVAEIERTLPLAPDGPAKQLMSVDGAMVPLVKGEWAEVRTLVLGDIQPPVMEKGEWVVHTNNLTYFSRLTDAAQFTRLALVETHACGVENAKLVAAVMDGAEWEQGFIDHHRPDAVRILDLPHAGEYIADVSRALWGEGTAQTKEWVGSQLHTLKHQGPALVLAELDGLQQEHPQLGVITTSLKYLSKRQNQMNYPQFIAQGLPIGSGSVECANKVVVEARLKGPGMHWARHNVDPMLALRNLACNDRWEQVWPQIVARLRADALQCQRQRRTQRQAALSVATAPSTAAPRTHPLSPSTSLCPSAQPSPTIPAVLSTPPSLAPIAQPVPAQQPKPPYRPPDNHPWRRMPVGKARFQPYPEKK